MPYCTLLYCDVMFCTVFFVRFISLHKNFDFIFDCTFAKISIYVVAFFLVLNFLYVPCYFSFIFYFISYSPFKYLIYFCYKFPIYMHFFCFSFIYFTLFYFILFLSDLVSHQEPHHLQLLVQIENVRTSPYL